MKIKPGFHNVICLYQTTYCRGQETFFWIKTINTLIKFDRWFLSEIIINRKLWPYIMKMNWFKRLSRHIRRKNRLSVLSQHGLAVLAETKNGLLAVEAGDFNVGRCLLNKGEYDHKEIEYLKQLIGGDCKHMLVVGSHVGSVLIPLAPLFQQVIAYEPDQQNHRLLNINLKLNDIGHVSVRNMAVGDQPGYVHMLRNVINTGNTSVGEIVDADEYSVPMTTLDEDVSISPIDLMIIDAEGYELNVIKGAHNTLKQTKMLYVEVAPEQLNTYDSNAIDLLHTLGKYFNYVRVVGNDKLVFDIDQGINWLEERMHQKGFLHNMLFYRS